jgi:hypothetical protein
MPAGKLNSSPSRAFLYLRVAGYFVYLLAFFLPACRQAGASVVGKPDVYQGWFCACFTIINSLNREIWRSKDALAILSGWINPLMLFYVAFLFSKKLRSARRVIAAAIVFLIGCTWVYFYLAPLMPLVGHFLWVAGILMILAGEAAKPRSEAAAEPS